MAEREEQLNVPAPSGYSANFSASVLKKQTIPPSGPKSKKHESRLGLPEFKWSLSLVGLCIYSFAIITFKFPVAQLGIALAVTGLFTGRDPVSMPLPVKLFAAYFLWALITVVISPFSGEAFDAWTERIKLFVIMLIIANTLQSAGQLRFYLLFILVCFLLFPARGTLVGGDSIQGRAVWNFVYANPNDLALLSFLAFGIALAIAFSESRWTFARLGATLGAIILLVVILKTQSRGVMVGLLVTTAPSFIPMLLKQLRLAIGVAIVLALIANFAVPQKLWDRLATMQKLANVEKIQEEGAQNTADSSSAERYEILKVGWKIFLDNPIFGVGIGAYPLANNKYAPELGARDTHNTYLNLAAELGVPGLLIWITMVGSILRQSHRMRRLAKDGPTKIQQYWLERTMIGFLVAAIFGSYSKQNFLYVMWSILWCSSMVHAKESPRPTHYTGTGRV